MRLNSLSCLSVVLVLAAFAGCRDKGNLKTVVVKGEVKYAGQPIEEGLIRFSPIDGTTGPANIARIRQGRYEMAARGGVPVGKHRVEIRAFKETAGAQPLPEGIPGAEQGVPSKSQFLPPKYNSKSILKITIPPGSLKITKDFDLSK